MKFDLQSLLEQARALQSNMEQIKKEFAEKTVTAEAGGGLVKATVNGVNVLTSLKISKEIVNPDDIEMLEDLIVAAVNKALDEAGKMLQEEMKKVTGNLPNFPGLNIF